MQDNFCTRYIVIWLELSVGTEFQFFVFFYKDFKSPVIGLDENVQEFP